MANQSQTDKRLRILTGPHSGAEIVLKPGSYVLGKSEQSDIVLDDDGLAPQHAIITVNENSSFALTPLAQPVAIADSKVDVDQNALEFKFPQRIILGSTHLALGLSANDLSLLSQHITPTNESVTADQKRTPSAGHSSNSRSLKSKLPSVGDILKPRRLYPIGAVSMLAACVMVVVSTVDSKPVHRPLNDDIPLAKVHRLVSDLQLPPLQIATTDKGTIEITGYVESIGQKNRLQHALRPLSSQVKVSVHSDEEILASASAILNSLKLTTVRVKKVDAGELYLEGYIEKKADWKNTKQVLARDISGISKIIDANVDTLEERLQGLRRIIARHQLADKVQIVVNQGSLTVTGALGKDELLRWHDAMQLYKERYGSQPKVNSRINDRPELDLKLRSVSVGSSPFVVTQSGGKYMEGSTLDNGYVLKAIKPDRIILSRNNSETVYYFGDK